MQQNPEAPMQQNPEVVWQQLLVKGGHLLVAKDDQNSIIYRNHLPRDEGTSSVQIIHLTDDQTIY